MKKLISIISIIAILLTSLMVFASCGGKGAKNTEWADVDTNKTIEWKFTDGELTIKAKDGSKGAVKLPDYDNSSEQPWKSYSASVTKITLSDISVVSKKAFADMPAVTSVDFGDDLVEIGELAFAFSTALTEVKIPEGVTTIGASAFEACSALKNVTLPHSLTSIGDRAFAYNHSLEKIVFSKSFEKKLTADQKSAIFKGAKDDLKVEFVNVSFDWTTTGDIQWKITTTTDKDGKSTVALTIQNAAGKSAPAIAKCTNDKSEVDPKLIPWFNYRELITKIELSNISAIPEKAFSGMTALTEVNFGKDLTKIEKSAFEGCTALKTVALASTVEKADGAFPEGVTFTEPQPDSDKPAETDKPADNTATDDNKTDATGDATEEVKESDTETEKASTNSVGKTIAIIAFAVILVGLGVFGIFVLRSRKNPSKDDRTVRKNPDDKKKSKNDKKNK